MGSLPGEDEIREKPKHKPSLGRESKRVNSRYKSEATNLFRGCFWYPFNSTFALSAILAIQHYYTQRLWTVWSLILLTCQLEHVQINDTRRVTYKPNTSVLPYLLTPCCRVLLEKLTGLQLVKKFPGFHGTRRFITALTSVRHLYLSWASPIQSIFPHPTSWRSIVILSTHLRLGLPSGLLPSGFPSKTLYTPLFSPICTTCPAHLILLDFITRTSNT